MEFYAPLTTSLFSNNVINFLHLSNRIINGCMEIFQTILKISEDCANNAQIMIYEETKSSPNLTKETLNFSFKIKHITFNIFIGFR